MKTEKKQKVKVVKQKFSWQLMWKQRYLLLMSVPFVIWLIIFKYVPLWGWTMAFQEVKPNSFALPVWQRKFVGFDNFKKAFTDRLFGQTMINTIGLSVLGIALGTVMAILFALMLNEICFNRFKKVTQTISYLPHFVSWVVIASIAKMVLNDGGMLDTLVGKNLKLMSTTRFCSGSSSASSMSGRKSAGMRSYISPRWQESTRGFMRRQRWTARTVCRESGTLHCRGSSRRWWCFLLWELVVL